MRVSQRLHLLPCPSPQAPSEYETSPDQLFYRIAHLNRGQQYLLWVAAVTSAGRGNISEKVTIEPAGKGMGGCQPGGTPPLLCPAPWPAGSDGWVTPGQRRGSTGVPGLLTPRGGCARGLPPGLTSSLPPSPRQDHLLRRHRHHAVDEGREAAVQLRWGADPCHQVDQGQVWRGLPAVLGAGASCTALAVSHTADVPLLLLPARTLPSR